MSSRPDPVSESVLFDDAAAITPSSIEEPKDTKHSSLEISVGRDSKVKVGDVAEMLAAMGAEDNRLRIMVATNAEVSIDSQSTKSQSAPGREPSLFAGGHQSVHSIETLRRYSTRLAVNKRRPALIDHVDRYVPATDVRSRKVRNRLLEIAKPFQFLDKGFAEFFAMVTANSDSSIFRPGLADIRGVITKKQPNKLPEDVNLGDLGHYCEDISRDQGAKLSGNLAFRPFLGRSSDVMIYLENSYEVLYWDFILDIFGSSEAHNQNLTVEAVTRAIYQANTEVKGLLRLLQDDLTGLADHEDIGTIVKGVYKRLEVLDSFVEGDIPNRATDELLYAILVPAEPLSPKVATRHDPGCNHAASTPPKRFVIISALVLFTAIGGIVPFGLGFAASSASTDLGSVSDADWWYNLSQTFSVVMGSIITIESLRKQAYWSSAYFMTGVWMGVSVACAVVSVVLYPNRNTRWSSLFATLATMTASGATLAMSMVSEQVKTEEIDRASLSEGERKKKQQ